MVGFFRKIMALCWLVLATSASLAAENPSVIAVSVEKLSQPHKLSLLALQGLMNRDGPRVILDFGADNRWMSMDYAIEPDAKELRIWDPETSTDFQTRNANTCQAWKEILSTRYHFTFQNQTWQQWLAASGKSATGWIVYDSFEEELALVATLAGQMDGLPVLRTDLPEMQKLRPDWPIVFDAASIPSVPEVGRKVSVHRWMIDHMLPKVNRSGLVSRVKSYGLEAHDTYVDIDQAVQQKWLVYDLTHYRDAVADKRDAKWERPHETAALQKILSSYPTFTPVYGWGAIDENTFVRTITESGLTVVCSGVPNNSFFHRWKAPNPTFVQRHRTADEIKLENKIYLAIMVNEGDSIKNALALQGHGAWLQPERGSIPINWGVDPILFDRYSGMMNYFYSTATPNDYFFSAAAGWGYVHPDRMTPAMAEQYVKLVNQGLKIADTKHLDVWWNPRSGPVWDIFARGLEIKGLTQWYNPEQKIGFNTANFPVADSNHYYTMKDSEEFARMLIDDYKTTNGPWFVVIYGANRHMTPYKAKVLMDHLPKERFKAVLLDEFFGAAQLARKEIEGKVWRPGPNAPKGTAP